MEKGSKDESMLREQMRTLWQDRVLWTRMMLVSVAASLEGDVDNIIKRLRRNQDDIGNVLMPYLDKYLFCWDDIPGKDTAILSDFLIQSFGINWIRTSVVSASKEDNGRVIIVKSVNNSISIRLNDERTKAGMLIDIGGRPHEFKFNTRAENGRLNIYLDGRENMNVLTTILKNSIIISKNFLKAKKAGDTTRDLEAIEALKDNAVSTAALLNGLKPSWPHNQFETLLLDYINLLREETVAYLNKNSDADLAAHERLMKLAMKIADTLVDGIIKFTSETAAIP